MIVVSLDTTRADRFAEIATSDPDWAPLWAESAHFAAAASPTPLTLPAHTSLFSAKNPNVTGVRNNGVRVPESLPLLADRLKARGYQTAAFVSAYPLDREFGLSRGFDVYDQATSADRGTTIEERPARATVPRAIDWLNQAGADPAFLFVHLFDAHAPYLPDGISEQADTAARYDGEIRAMGQALAPLFATLKARQRPFVLVVVGDHGEGLGDHGEYDHGLLLYDSTLLVPMLWWAPKMFAPGPRPGLPRLIDLTPTLLELAGAAPIEASEGISLLPALRGQDLAIPPAYAESYYGTQAYGTLPLRSLRDHDLKWIGTSALAEQELYDWSADPREQNNLVDADATQTANADRLQIAAFERPEPTALAGPDSEASRKLQSLGYVGAGSTATSGNQHPNELIQIHARLTALQELDRQTHLSEAVTEAEALVSAAPNLPHIRVVLADLQEQAGNSAAALQTWQVAVALRPDDAQSHFRLATLLLRLGQDEASIPHWQAVQALDPGRLVAYTNHAVALANLQRWEQAWTALQPALAKVSTDDGTLDAAALIAAQTHRPADAAAALLRLATLRPAHVDWLKIGRLQWLAGDAKNALASFERVPSSQGAKDVAEMGAAAALEQLGRTSDADARRQAVQTRNPRAHAAGLQWFSKQALQESATPD
ncbi:sulfatase-like hydrolase/transferase [Ahniella affigens]|nr:sulfatase-like hydrolase/transferase [Ahniella affigens]